MFKFRNCIPYEGTSLREHLEIPSHHLEKQDKQFDIFYEVHYLIIILESNDALSATCYFLTYNSEQPGNHHILKLCN